MKKLAILILVFSFKVFVVNAQNVGIGTDSPHVSAKLEVTSNNSGFLPPRMTTTQRNTIVNPVAGLQIYNTTTDCLEIFSKGRWQKMFCGVDDTTQTVDSTLVTDIDGHTYPTVKICNQTWMAKNLDVARYRNGDIIPQVTDPTEWANLTTGAWCWYNNDSATYGSVYGRLYNWYAVNDPRGLAPEGWHVPSDGEFDTLTNCLGGADVAGGKMKSTGTQFWASPNTGATNFSGFNALPGGIHNYNGTTFYNINNGTVFWSSSFKTENESWDIGIYSNSTIIDRGYSNKNYGFSVRCVKDTPITTTTTDSTLLTDIDGQTYPTVKICNQTWMAKNLDVARYRNGDIIPQVTDPTEWANLTTGAWCWYNNDSATYGSVYGRLYNWYAVNDPRGLAPEGWHVASDGEWTTLTDCLGGADVAGGKLKEAGTSHWASPNTGATNSSGFCGLPSGYRGSDGRLNAVGQISVFGSSTLDANNDVWRRIIYFQSESVSIATNPKNYGYAIRCVKDTPITTLNNGLVAYYPFSGNAGDSSGNGNHGTVNGATLTTDRFGNSGKAYSFDGVNSIIQTSSDFFNASNDFTISLWLKSDGLQQNQTVFNTTPHNVITLSYNYFTHPQGYLMLLYGGAQFGNWYNQPGDIFSPTISLQNQWSYITLTKTNGRFSVYQNGLILTSAAIIQNPTSTLTKVNFGRCDPSTCNEPYFGSLDDIRIYNRALTQAEITYLATH